MRLPILITLHIITLHISAGIVGLISGAAAMSFRKGSHRHRVAGNVFVVAMLTMGMCGSYLAVMKHSDEQRVRRAADGLPGEHGLVGGQAQRGRNQYL